MPPDPSPSPSSPSFAPLQDIKPGNVLIGGGPTRGGEFKLADFGLATQLGDGTQAYARTWVGTELFMSPERLVSGGAGSTTGEGYKYPSDVWSAGLTLLAVATGRFPYNDRPDGAEGGAEFVDLGP